MALLRLKNGKTTPIAPDKALALWRVLNGEVEGSPEQVAFCRTVDRVYLNWHTAPRSYKHKYQLAVEQMYDSDDMFSRPIDQTLDRYK